MYRKSHRVAHLAPIAWLLFSCAAPPGGEPPSVEDAVQRDAADDSANQGDSVSEGAAEARRDSPSVPDTDRRSEASDPLAPCNPVLSIEPEVSFVLPYELTFLAPQGGTGAYEFVLTDDTVGTLNSTTGAFLAGAEADVSSRVFVTDTGCSGVVEARIDVVNPMVVIPSAPQVSPGTAIPFRVEAGSGDVQLALVSDESGATLDGELYLAGPLEGVDVLRVRDLRTTEERFVYVEVRSDAALVPTTWWPQVALGQTLLFEVQGGAGDFTYTLTGDVVSYDGKMLTGLTAGTGTIEVLDGISGMSLSIPVGVSAPLSSPANRSGDLSDQASMLSADLDGDGYEEVIVGVSELDYEAHNSGAVYVYQGGEEGLEAAPARVYANDERGVKAGSALALGDFDADGVDDLAIGVPEANPGVSKGGAVHIHAGVAGELPSEEPERVLGGPFSGDRLGAALAACDFNGDGVDDLVASAMFGENRALLKPFNDQGALHVFLGSAEEGLAEVADQVIYGHLLFEGELIQRGGLKLGRSLAAGDFDGDGACDLAVSTINWSFNENQLNREDGGVFLYRGRHAEPGVSGGLEPTPSRIWGADEDGGANTRFGFAIAMADVNQDGFSDLVVTQPRYKVPGQGGNRHGAVSLFLGAPLANHPPEVTVAPSEALWRGLGSVSNALFGHSVTFADVGQDGSVNLVLGDPRATNEDNHRNGCAFVYEFDSADLSQEAQRTSVCGVEPQDYFGTAVTTVSGDVAAMASRSDLYGLNVGAPFVEQGAGTSALDFPGLGTGDGYGNSLTFTGDLTGDGVEDLVVGVPLEDPVELGSNAGVVMIYRGTADGVESAPVAVLKGFRTHGEGDQFGRQVFDMGDVDGDGIDDMGVLSGVEGIPQIGAFGDGLFNDGACEFGANNVGALYIFRGSADGAPQAEPAFIVYGLKSGSRLDSVVGGVDVNNDGRADIIAGNPTYDVPSEPELNDQGELVPVNGQGAVAVYFGQPSAANGTTIVLCAPSAVITGRQNNGRLGHKVASMGDIDGDGCGDFAASAFNEEYSAELEGAIHLVRGWGGPGCPTSPMLSVFSPGIEDVRAGLTLVGGQDLDGDGVPDLVMANSTFTSTLLQQGMVWLISGAHMVAQATHTAESWSDAEVNPLWPYDVSAEIYRRAGATKQARFGTSLALSEPQGDGPSQLIVGAPYGAASGVFAGGSAYALTFSSETGFSETSAVSFGGESFRPFSMLGTSVSVGRVGGTSMIAVGGPDASAVSVDNGAAYVLTLSE